MKWIAQLFTVTVIHCKGRGFKNPSHGKFLLTFWEISSVEAPGGEGDLSNEFFRWLGFLSPSLAITCNKDIFIACNPKLRAMVFSIAFNPLLNLTEINESDLKWLKLIHEFKPMNYTTVCLWRLGWTEHWKTLFKSPCKLFLQVSLASLYTLRV